MDEEIFVTIPEFPLYSVSNYGRVVNNEFDYGMTMSPTQNGEMTVGLSKDGRQFRRSVKVLVARAFVPGETKADDTPILLDNNRTNLRADNIMWRPRWFAHKYRRQFDRLSDWADRGAVQDIFTGEVYDNAYHAATTNGMLIMDIVLGCFNESRVYPTFTIFRFC